MRFEDFTVGQIFAASITVTRADIDNYISFARTKNVLLENSQLVEKEDRGDGILAIDFEINRTKDKKLVVVSPRDLYRIKK